MLNVSDKITVRVDGGANPNPGNAGIAFTIEKEGKIRYLYSEFIDYATNNEAEYLALVKALEFVKENFPKAKLLVLSDSQLMVRQLNGEYKIRSKKLCKLKEKIDELLGQMDFEIKWNERKENKLADYLVRLIRGEINVR